MDKSEKLDGKKSEYIERLKRLALLEAGVDYNNVDTYVKYITADKSSEMQKQAFEIVEDIKRQNTAKPDVYHDPRSWNPFE